MELHHLSVFTRVESLKVIATTEFDLLIIGGGITGAGIALDAVSRGMTVCLIEKNDFASGTSSRSTKLIHGGLRYLEQFAFKLVRETGSERSVVRQNVAHLVIPQQMMLPIVTGGKLNRFTAFAALKLYDALAGVLPDERMKMLSKQTTLQLEPLLNPELITRSALYFEYKTDDSRLTIEVIKKASEYGAICLNYFKFDSFIYSNTQIAGVVASDSLNNQSYSIKAKKIVNATGVWSDEIRKKDGSLYGKKLHITKGVHIVVPRERLPIGRALYFDTPDKRMVFVIPKNRTVYIGTTDTNFAGHTDQPDVTIADITYLLTSVNRIFPTAYLSINDVLSSWSGLRPLIHQEGKKPSDLSRKDEIILSPSGLITIAGGKLTAYRLMAKKVVDMVAGFMQKRYKSNFPPCKTKRIPVSGADFPFEPLPYKLTEFADKLYDEAKQTGISVDEFNRLFYRYGTNLPLIIEKSYELYDAGYDRTMIWLHAEIWYCIYFEMATTLSDFFIRRTSMLLFEREKVLTQMANVAEIMMQYLKKDEVWRNVQIQEMTQAYQSSLAFVQ